MLRITSDDFVGYNHLKPFSSKLKRVPLTSQQQRIKLFFQKYLPGSSTVGEFINPAYDCSDVINQVQHASDGFYWITLGSLKSAKKVNRLMSFWEFCLRYENMDKLCEIH